MPTAGSLPEKNGRISFHNFFLFKFCNFNLEWTPKNKTSLLSGFLAAPPPSDVKLVTEKCFLFYVWPYDCKLSPLDVRLIAPTSARRQVIWWSGRLYSTSFQPWIFFNYLFFFLLILLGPLEYSGHFFFICRVWFLFHFILFYEATWRMIPRRWRPVAIEWTHPLQFFSFSFLAEMKPNNQLSNKSFEHAHLKKNNLFTCR